MLNIIWVVVYMWRGHEPTHTWTYLEPCNLWMSEKKSSSGTVGAGRWLLGKDDLCSSILDPWHFINVSKNESSGSCSPPLEAAVTADSCCRTSDCLLCISPGRNGTLEAGLAWLPALAWWWAPIMSRRSLTCFAFDLKFFIVRIIGLWKKQQFLRLSIINS